MWGVTEGMKGSQKFEDKFGLKELASNWSESFFPAWASPVCLSVLICVLGVKLPPGDVPA